MNFIIPNSEYANMFKNDLYKVTYFLFIHIEALIRWNNRKIIGVWGIKKNENLIFEGINW